MGMTWVNCGQRKTPLERSTTAILVCRTRGRMQMVAPHNGRCCEVSTGQWVRFCSNGYIMEWRLICTAHSKPPTWCVLGKGGGLICAQHATTSTTHFIALPESIGGGNEWGLWTCPYHDLHTTSPLPTNGVQAATRKPCLRCMCADKCARMQWQRRAGAAARGACITLSGRVAHCTMDTHAYRHPSPSAATVHKSVGILRRELVMRRLAAIAALSCTSFSPNPLKSVVSRQLSTCSCGVCSTGCAWEGLHSHLAVWQKVTWQVRYKKN